MRFNRSFIKLIAATAVGVPVGIGLERYRQNTPIGLDTHHKPSGLLEMLKLSAASPFSGPSAVAVVPADPGPIAPRTSQIMRFGFPSTDSIRSFDDFILSYDRRCRTANWVFEHLTPELLAVDEAASRENSEFFEDSSIHPYFRATNQDYRGSGFDRGHLAAAGNHRRAQQFIDSTFVLSNISPQVGKGFNRDAWNKLEKYVRYRAKRSRNLYVCTGPLYLPRQESDGKKYVKYQVIGDNNVAVPTHFFKVLLVETTNGTYELETFVMPNRPIDDKIPLEAFHVPIDSVERAAGLLFFDKMPKHLLSSVNRQKG